MGTPGIRLCFSDLGECINFLLLLPQIIHVYCLSDAEICCFLVLWVMSLTDWTQRGLRSTLLPTSSKFQERVRFFGFLTL